MIFELNTISKKDIDAVEVPKIYIQMCGHFDNVDVLDADPSLCIDTKQPCRLHVTLHLKIKS